MAVQHKLSIRMPQPLRQGHLENETLQADRERGGKGEEGQKEGDIIENAHLF